MLKGMKIANFAIISFAVTAPMAHVLELPNKFVLEGPLWLAVQQHLYRGWGALFGPVEIIALLTALLLVWLRRANGVAFRASLVAALAYAAMLGVFFIFNAPVNAAFNSWTVDSMPANWPEFRWRWEVGHAIAAGLSLVGWLALLRASFADRKPVA
ncbi:MAG: DUF1772 domain-containing protein [Parvibaculum sp.]|nr:DUF1772 domain-containing protein [Parvibaculum sp.]